jgi:predicted GNAT family N-acyltransferase
MSKITLKPITYENQYYITSLNSGYDGVYVASNANTIIQAFFKKTIKNVRAIYLETKLKNKAKAETKIEVKTEDAKPIGLIYAELLKNKRVLSIRRFMINQNYQGKGYGTQAFNIGLKFYVKKHKPEMIELSSKNKDAIKLYKKFGFIEDSRIVKDKGDKTIYLIINVKDIIYMN